MSDASISANGGSGNGGFGAAPLFTLPAPSRSNAAARTSRNTGRSRDAVDLSHGEEDLDLENLALEHSPHANAPMSESAAAQDLALRMMSESAGSKSDDAFDASFPNLFYSGGNR